LSESSAINEAERLLELSDQVSRIAGTLARLSTNLASGSEPINRADEQCSLAVSEDAVNWLIQVRRARFRYLSNDLFADPAWDMLLDLLKAEIKGTPVSVSSVCIASGVPSSTALRWLRNLMDQGLVSRTADEQDGRRKFVRLAPEVSTSLRRYFIDVVQHRSRRSTTKTRAD